MVYILKMIQTGLVSIMNELATYRQQFKLVPQRVRSVYRHTEPAHPTEYV